MLTVCLSSVNLMFLFQQKNICVIWTFQGYSFSRSSFLNAKMQITFGVFLYIVHWCAL